MGEQRHDTHSHDEQTHARRKDKATRSTPSPKAHVMLKETLILQSLQSVKGTDL